MKFIYIVFKISVPVSQRTHWISFSKTSRLMLYREIIVGFEVFKTVTGPLVAGFPPQRLGLDPRSGHVGFVVNNVTLEQIFSECSVIRATSHATNCSIIILILSSMLYRPHTVSVVK
jgi:hypothetical protein